ncbi:MAG: NAD(P)-dependent oxidoreductase [Paludibacter sp.]|nr:NAD(P)-dependent oxidoreductase [Paludibacter sp.]
MEIKSKLRVLVTTKLFSEGFSSLNEDFDVVFPTNDFFSKKEVIETISGFDALVSTFQFKVDKEVIEATKGKLKIIANYGVGFDNIDVECATRNAIVVTNTPNPVVEPTAEHTFGLMLVAARRIAECDRKIRLPHGLKWGVMENLGQSLYGKTLGIIGMGRIGRAVARRAIANGMKIVYYNRTKLTPNIELAYQAQRLDLDELLKISDVVTLHTPLTERTYHIINQDSFKEMKPTVILVNTSRGPVVDEIALIDALQNKRIAAAALDVYEFEPNISKELFELDNVVLSPHNGTATIEARNEMSRFVSQNIIRFFDGKSDITRVN